MNDFMRLHNFEHNYLDNKLGSNFVFIIFQNLLYDKSLSPLVNNHFLKGISWNEGNIM